jgi:hypothetical protein
MGTCRKYTFSCHLPFHPAGLRLDTVLALVTAPAPPAAAGLAFALVTYRLAAVSRRFSSTYTYQSSIIALRRLYHQPT